MVKAIKDLLLIAGIILFATALILSFRPEWLMMNISPNWFYALMVIELLLGATCGIYWMWRKRDIDSIFFPSSALSLFLGIGFLRAREWTTDLFGPSDFLLLLILCIAMGGGAAIALNLTMRSAKPSKGH